MPTEATSQPETAHRLRVFLSHASEDKPAVRGLYERLRAEGFIEPWLDEENLLPGQDWWRETEKAVRSSDVVVVCLSQSSVDQAGTVQREIKLALDLAEAQPESAIFVIPVKLEECQLPNQLSHLYSVNLFEERGYEQLSRGLNYRATTVHRNSRVPTRHTRIFISYEQNVAIDALLASRLSAALQAVGHEVFVDRNMQSGLAWVNKIQQQIDASDFMLVLLSEISAQSEMIAKEVEFAYRNHQGISKPQLLPIKINLTNHLPYQLGYYLDQLPYVYWQSEEQDQWLIEQVLNAINKGYFSNRKCQLR